MKEAPQLLDDEAVRRFLREGYLSVAAPFDEPVHAQIRTRLEAIYEAERNPGNNLLPRLPQIQRVYDHPAVRGALTSLLGPGYWMHPHRHGHLNPAGSKGQGWHKDSYVYDAAIRHPRPRFLLALYYPQDVTQEMGPTGLIPGRHYYPAISSADPAWTTEPRLGLCAPAGTVTLVHNDSWHCAMPNTSEKPRFMLKFLFERRTEPEEMPAGAWEPRTDDPFDAVHADVWRWLHGQPAPPAAPWSVDEAARLLGRLDSDDIETSLPAAYALAAFGAPAVSGLIATMEAQAAAAAETFTAKSPGNPHGINPHALPAASALAAIGAPSVEPLTALLRHPNWCVRAQAADTLGNSGRCAQAAVSALVPLVDDEHPRVRRQAVEALGRMGEAGAPALRALTQRLRDPEVFVRHNAAVALARIGLPYDDAVPALVETLEDDDRYVRHFAAVALRAIGTPRANDALLDALFTARWCEKTSPVSMY